MAGRADLQQFGEDGRHLIHFRQLRGEVEYFDLTGFWAIGSGQTAALGALFNKKHSRYIPYKRVLLNLCEAKFAAEDAPGVGKGSFVVVVHPNGDHFTTLNLEPARKAYEKVRRRPITKRQKDAVETILKSLSPAQEQRKSAEEKQPDHEAPEGPRPQVESEQDPKIH